MIVLHNGSSGLKLRLSWVVWGHWTVTFQWVIIHYHLYIDMLLFLLVEHRHLLWRNSSAIDRFRLCYDVLYYNTHYVMSSPNQTLKVLIWHDIQEDVEVNLQKYYIPSPSILLSTSGVRSHCQYQIRNSSDSASKNHNHLYVLLRKANVTLFAWHVRAIWRHTEVTLINYSIS